MDGCVMDGCFKQTHKSLLPKLPFLSFCNIPIFLTTIFFTQLCGLFWVFVGSQTITSIQQKTLFSFPSSSSPTFSISFPLFIFLPIYEENQRVVSHYPVFDDSKARFKHQTLVQDYHDLEKRQCFRKLGDRTMATKFGGNEKHSCETAADTLQWIRAIVDFIKPYSFFINAPVVNFFKDRLWEAVDTEWMECLRKEPVKNLLLIPSGAVQDYWPDSLKKFIRTSRSLAFQREQADLQTVLPGWCMASLNTVLSQGMNQKKKHEVGVLSAITSLIASDLRSHSIVDVGAGQGYLAQVLSFHYKHSVLAIDACSHHGNVTSARATRIKKYYLAQIRKSGLEAKNLRLPKALTFHVLSVDALKSLANMSLQDDHVEETSVPSDDQEEKTNRSESKCLCSSNKEPSLVLAGLHACGDLSVIMLRAFVECKEVKAVINIGCCYNLLSEDGCVQNGFPMSLGVKTSGLSLGKSGRDLACQSAERWRNLENEAGLHNFELHGFRAAFQMVLYKYYPEVVATCPSVGRQGKALRRRKKREATLSSRCHEDKLEVSQSDHIGELPVNIDNGSMQCRQSKSVEKYPLFEKFCQSGLNRLGLQSSPDMDYHGLWMDTEPFAGLIGPYWSLRAALGPVLETCILLDRLLFLQEQGGSLEAIMLPIFDPDTSPRNVAIIAKKVGAT